MSGDFISVLTVIVQKRLLNHLNCDKSKWVLHTTSEEKMNKVSKNQPNHREREGGQPLQASRLSTPAYNARGCSVGFTPTSPPLSTLHPLGKMCTSYSSFGAGAMCHGKH